MPLWPIDKVIRLLKLKFAVFVKVAQLRKRERMRKDRIAVKCVVLIAQFACPNAKHCKFTADFDFKSLITLLIGGTGTYYFSNNIISSLP